MAKQFPIKSLIVQGKGAKDRLALAFLWLRDFLFGFCPLPPPLYIGFIAKVRFINKADLEVPLVPLRLDDADNLVHPTFFSSELGAWAGIVLAKRL